MENLMSLYDKVIESQSGKYPRVQDDKYVLLLHPCRLKKLLPGYGLEYLE